MRFAWKTPRENGRPKSGPREVESNDEDGTQALRVTELLDVFPVAVLKSL